MAGRDGTTGGLRRTLVLRIMLSGLVAIAGSVVLLGAQIQRAADRDADRDVQRRTAQAADDLAGLFGRWHDEMLVAAQDAALTDWFAEPGRRAQDIAQVNAMMISLHAIYPQLIDEACFIAASGQELARQVHGTAAPGSDLSPDESDNPFFKGSFQVGGGEVFQSSPYVSPDSDRWVVANSTPIVVAGRKAAILHFEANLDAVRGEMRQALGPGMRARIVDVGLGKVIADTGADEAIVKAPFATAGDWVDAAGPVRASTAVTVGAQNVNRWRIELSAPRPDPFTAGMLTWTLLGVLVAMLVVAGVAYRIATAIARPIVQVTDATESIVATGDRSRRVRVPARDEVGALSRSIDTMLDHLQEQDEEIRRAQRPREEQLRANWEQQQVAEQNLRDATSQVKQVVAEQAGTVQRLDHAVGQALTRIESMARVTDELERRGSERFMTAGPVQLDDGRGHRSQAGLVDISAGGLRCVITAGPRPDLDRTVTVELTLAGRPLRLPARVVHRNGDGNIGLQFLDPPPDEVAHIRRSAAGPAGSSG